MQCISTQTLFYLFKKNDVTFILITFFNIYLLVRNILEVIDYQQFVVLYRKCCEQKCNLRFIKSIACSEEQTMHSMEGNNNAPSTQK